MTLTKGDNMTFLAKGDKSFMFLFLYMTYILLIFVMWYHGCLYIFTLSNVLTTLMGHFILKSCMYYCIYFHFSYLILLWAFKKGKTKVKIYSVQN